jgi:hypothetical protein
LRCSRYAWTWHGADKIRDTWYVVGKGRQQTPLISSVTRYRAQSRHTHSQSEQAHTLTVRAGIHTHGLSRHTHSQLEQAHTPTVRAGIALQTQTHLTPGGCGRHGLRESSPDALQALTGRGHSPLLRKGHPGGAQLHGTICPGLQQGVTALLGLQVGRGGHLGHAVCCLLVLVCQGAPCSQITHPKRGRGREANGVQGDRVCVW